MKFSEENDLTIFKPRQCRYKTLVGMEGLKLLAAVAYVVPEDWKLLLVECGVTLRDEDLDQKIPAKFVLKIDAEMLQGDLVKARIVRWFGANQHERYSDDYLKALAKIASVRDNLQLDKPGVGIQVPMQLCFDANWAPICIEAFSEAEKRIREQWRSVEWSAEKGLPSGSLQCTFVMGPMIADFSDYSKDSPFYSGFFGECDAGSNPIRSAVYSHGN